MAKWVGGVEFWVQDGGSKEKWFARGRWWRWRTPVRHSKHVSLPILSSTSS